MTHHKKTLGLSIAALILGICSLLFGWIPIFGWIVVLGGIISSSIAIAKTRHNKKIKGEGLAIAGLVLSIVGALFALLTVGGLFMVSNIAEESSKELGIINDQMNEDLDTLSNNMEDSIMDAQDKQKLVDTPEKKQEEIPLNSLVENTNNQITLKLHDIKIVKNAEDWGRIEEIDFTIENRGKESIFHPFIAINLYNEDDETKTKVQLKDKVGLEIILSEGQATHQLVPLDVGYRGDINNTLILKVSLFDGWDWNKKNLVSVYYDVEFD